MQPEAHVRPLGAAPHAHHFANPVIQKHAERMGMWLFLTTEILLFAGLFVAYGLYRLLFPETFEVLSTHLDVRMGTFNTLLLITSSLTVALAVHAAKMNNNRAVVIYYAVSIAMGLGFMVVKGFEYAHKFHVGALPGRFYTLDVQMPGDSMFFVLYFFTTGLHAIHVIIGMAVLAWVMIRAMRHEFSSQHYIPVELSGLYWHLVDLVWIFLFPLLYLV